jgi:GAF domain-containing protein
MTNKTELFESLVRRVGEILDSRDSKANKLKAICKILKDNISYYDWVGFYIVDKKRQDELLLGPFVGEPTQHTRIPFGKGICGQAAKLQKTFVVQDTSKETNYLSCSTKVKSEIVVPIFKDEAIVGELDIDSHCLSPFTEEDEQFLRRVSAMVSELL